tara:strand:+ start:696 stop:1190 length:495 start_codon:yes stop_codon:yes gene_type:complete
MKTSLLLLFFFVSAAIIQQLSPNITFFGNIKFPFFSSIMVYACFRLSKRNAWICSLLSAIIFDSLEPGPYGPALLTYPVITFLILKFRNNLFHDGLVTQIICGGMCYFFITLTSGFFFLITNVREIDFFPLKLIGSLFLGSITLPICSYLLSNSIPSEERGGIR